jgi:xanthine dehydrogenase accessory factor
VTRLDEPAGAKLLVLDDGTVEGSLGAAALDERFVDEARDTMAQGTSRVATIEGTRGFIEVFAPAALLVIVGAGHVTMPLTSLAKVLGYRTVVLDARPRFATRERFPDVDELQVGIPSELVERYPMTAATALVLVVHDYKYDLPVLKYALATDVSYVGMLGSARRGATILKMLGEDGVSETALGRVHVPIGLDIGARSAPEIALAVLAEIQAVRAGGTGQPLSVVRRGRAAGPGPPRLQGMGTE